jgi:hypothetical protein
MKKVFKYIGHSDHGITKMQIEFIQQNRDLLELPDGTFIKKIIELPKNIGTAESSLYGPESGDKPVMEREVFYIRRGKRNGATRMIDKPKRLVKKICVIGIRNGIAFTMYGTNSNKPSPMEIWDKKFKYLSYNEQEEIRKFWNEHAISSH